MSDRRTLKRQKTPFAVKRRGISILDYPLKGGADAGITYSQSFFAWEAATAAGLDVWEWESGKYPNWFMARVVAWYRLHKLVEAHSQDAAMSKKK